MRYRQAEPLANLEKMLRNSNKYQIRNTLGASTVARMVKNLPAMQEAWVPSLGWEDSLEKEMATQASTLAWKIQRKRSPVGYSSWGRRESDTTE